MDILAAVLEISADVLSLLVTALLVYQLILSFFGFKRNTKDYEDHEPQMRFLALVPAHNEAKVIASIIRNLQNMDYPKELYDFYILADNCTDNTAQIARDMGANVLESHKQSPDEPNGKPIVLQKALHALEGYQDKYDLIMFFDADNLIDTDMFREVNSQYLSYDKKADMIQCYLGCKNNAGFIPMADYLSYTISNRFIQYAKHRLGLNAGIGGTGFAVSAPYLHDRGGWTSLSLTEDFELQIEATCEGRRILWNNQVRIYDEKPTSLKACFRQRTRWAQGRWFVTFKNTKALFRAFKNKRIGFWEFLSSFTFMYNMIPFVFLCIEAVPLGIVKILRWTGAIAPATAASTAVSASITGLLIFVYSLFFLFYVGDFMDNHRRPSLKELPWLASAVMINTVVTGPTHLLGLFKHRKQNNWVKTEHSINQQDDMNVRLSDMGITKKDKPEELNM